MVRCHKRDSGSLMPADESRRRKLQGQPAMVSKVDPWRFLVVYAGKQLLCVRSTMTTSRRGLPQQIRKIVGLTET